MGAKQFTWSDKPKFRVCLTGYIPIGCLIKEYKKRNTDLLNKVSVLICSHIIAVILGYAWAWTVMS